MKFQLMLLAAVAALMTFAPTADATVSIDDDTVAALDVQRRGGGSRSSFGSSRSRSSSQRRTTSSRSTKPSSSSRPTKGSSSSRTKSTKPKSASSKYDSKASVAKRRTTSKADYKTKAVAYKATQKKNSSRISSMGGGKTYSRSNYNTRATRQTTVVYSSYYGRSYPGAWGGYNDGISPYFWLWMMSNNNSQAQYVHNHSGSMDQARLTELYASNATLQAEVAALKASGVAPNPNALPEGMSKDNADMMFTDEFAANAAGLNAPLPPDEGLGGFVWFLIIMGCLIMIGGIFFCLKL
jgi:hypothetical protein